MDFNTISSLAFIAMTLEIIQRGADLTKAATETDRRLVDCVQHNVANGGEVQVSDRADWTARKSSLCTSSSSTGRARRHGRRRARHPGSADDVRLNNPPKDAVDEGDDTPRPVARRRKGSRRRDRRLTTELLQNFTTSPTEELVSSSEAAAEEETTAAVVSTESSTGTEATSLTSDDVRSDDVMKDWLWTATFLKGNVEKLVLYAALGLTLGALGVMSACLLRLCLTRRSTSPRRARLHRDSNSPSPLSTGQTTPTAHGRGIATRKSPGSPVWSRDDGTGARLAKSAALQVQQDRRNEMSGNGWSANPEDRLLASSQEPAQELPFYEPWGGGGGGASRSLGRPYTNPYRHDSYRVDGMRTMNNRPPN